MDVIFCIVNIIATTLSIILLEKMMTLNMLMSKMYADLTLHETKSVFDTIKSKRLEHDDITIIK